MRTHAYAKGNTMHCFKAWNTEKLDRDIANQCKGKKIISMNVFVTKDAQHGYIYEAVVVTSNA